MRVLITGACGFVGRHMAALCAERDCTVVGLGRSVLAGDGSLAGDRSLAAPGEAPPLGDYIQADLGDASAARAAVRAAAPDRVLHLAAQASVPASWEDPRATLEGNLLSTHNLLEAVRAEAPAARVLVAGSGEVYGPVAAERLPVGEQEPLRPQNPYAVSKAASDLLAGFYADAHGLTVVRTRAFNHAGPGQSEAYVVSTLARQIARAELDPPAGGRVEIALGNAAARRDFTDVRDVVRAYWMLLEHGEQGAFNVCSGASTAVADIVAGLARHTSLGLDQRTDPARVRSREVMEIRGSHDRLTEATGWRPEIAVEAMLGDTVAWWRERLAAGERA